MVAGGVRGTDASRIMKLVAQTSSSRTRQDAPSSRASWMLAAWLVLPLASGELKHCVSLPAHTQAKYGRSADRHARQHHPYTSCARLAGNEGWQAAYRRADLR